MKKFVYQLLIIVSIASGIAGCKVKPHEDSTPLPEKKVIREVWSADKANEWYSKQTWPRGADFLPSTAINQLEMWQAETFDTTTINRELGWAEGIGYNSMRVYLHHLAWQIDKDGFKNRMDTYLSIADRHHITTLFVFFDDCWNPKYKQGKQPEPKLGIHNSGWVRDPGDTLYATSDTTIYPLLKEYVQDVLTKFSNDKRIILWDLYNEPGNSGYGNKSMNLLKRAFMWAREVDPIQPLSSGVWAKDLVDLNRFQLANSDVITYHNYMEKPIHQQWIDSLRTYGRPLICTEYMARTRGSLFKEILPMLKEQNIGAYNWGLVSGKSNTIYAWDTPIPSGKEPKIWFHDIFRKDGTPYDPAEVKLIREVTGVKAQ
jgi:hypothetical protein